MEHISFAPPLFLNCPVGLHFAGGAFSYFSEVVDLSNERSVGSISLKSPKKSLTKTE
jgi:hypothetical protein